MASNETIIADQDGEYDDWIELYNPTLEDVSLRNIYLSDKTDDVLKWEFPDTLIQAESYLIIWADNDITQSGLHANFKLSSTGESVVLSNNNASIIDSITYYQQYTDTSYGRLPNATGPFQLLNPTFSSYNEALSVFNISNENMISIFPNPAKDNLQVLVSNEQLNETMNILSVEGKVLKEYKIQNKETTINIEELEKGIYFIRIENVVRKFVKK